MKIYQSYSSAETKRLGYKLAAKLLKYGARSTKQGALVLALMGELGSGKTTFIQGFLRGLGVRKRSPSPTFIIFRKLKISRSNVNGQMSDVRSVYHVDAYRIKKPRELAALGLEEVLRNSQNVVLIEWAENIKKVLPKSTIWLKFHHGRKENERIVEY